jgi:ATP-dependent helicase HrpA
LHAAARPLGGERRLEEALAARVIRDLFAAPVRTAREFAERVAAGSARMVPAAREWLYALIPVLEAYAGVRRALSGFAGAEGPLADVRRRMEEELAHLAPANFIALYERERLAHLVRYLEALAVRAQRALAAPEKERLKSEGLRPVSERFRRLLGSLGPGSSTEKRRAMEALFWLIEEYKVSIFAQELKTALPVSTKRLEKTFREVERMG